MCNKNYKKTQICDNCDAANVLTIVKKFDLDEEEEYDWEQCNGIYLDSCCSMNADDLKLHLENCFHKSSCDICSISIAASTSLKYRQCDHCTNLIEYNISATSYYCDCESEEDIFLCTTCTELNQSRITKSEDFSEVWNIDCGNSPMIKAAK